MSVGIMVYLLGFLGFFFFVIVVLRRGFILENVWNKKENRKDCKDLIEFLKDFLFVLVF